jgi:hypothetical protein
MAGRPYNNANTHRSSRYFTPQSAVSTPPESHLPPALAFYTHVDCYVLGLDVLRLCVPIQYIPRTRPPFQGPFPAISTSSSPAQPCTSFIDLVHSRKPNTPPIQTQVTFLSLFIPSGLWAFSVLTGRVSPIRYISQTRRLYR